MFTVTKISERHDILSKTIGTTLDENRSYENAQVLLGTSLAFFIIGSILEAIAFLIFTFKVLFVIIPAVTFYTFLLLAAPLEGDDGCWTRQN